MCVCVCVLHSPCSLPCTQTIPSHQRRRRRHTHPSPKIPPACQVNDIFINTSSIPLSSTLGEGSIIAPDSYNAKICGGSCGNTLPRYNKHSRLLHYWLTSNDFEHPPYEGWKTKFHQSCAPIEYKSLTVIFKPKNEPWIRLVLLRNMRIVQCDCLEVIEFS